MQQRTARKRTDLLCAEQHVAEGERGGQRAEQRGLALGRDHQLDLALMGLGL
jgi:hypothetical protein